MEAERRVYVVDDDLIVLRAIDRLLRASGFTVQAFDSPSAFLGRLPYDGPACLVLDLRMPELNGLEVQEQLALQTTAMPIVFFLAWAGSKADATARARTEVVAFEDQYVRAQTGFGAAGASKH